MSNCTIVTGLFNTNRENWSSYRRPWNQYLNNFKNILSLDSKMIIYIEESTYNFVLSERLKIDPNQENTIIVKTEFNQLPKYHLYDMIKSIMNSDDYKNGLVEKEAPEYKVPEYSMVILSKIDLIARSIDLNPFNTEYFMWVDAGLCHDHFKQEHINMKYPDPNKIAELGDKVSLLCRSMPQPSDLEIGTFFKAHINRFGAGVIAGNKKSIAEFKNEFDKILDEAIEKKLIDSEQSLFSICYLRNPDLFKLHYGGGPHPYDWYSLFYHFI